jgi:putative ABC transport system permease protein
MTTPVTSTRLTSTPLTSTRQPTAAALSLSLVTIRSRWASFAGAFIALAGGVAIIVPMLLTLASALQTPFPGPQRFAGAPVVVIPHDTLTLTLDGTPVGLSLGAPPPLPAALVARLSAAGRAVPDRTFAVHTAGGPAAQSGHGWSAAALGGYRLTAGHAPAAASQIVVASDSAAQVGRSIRVVTPDGQRSFTVSGVVAPRWFENAVFFTDQAAARLDPAVDAVAVFGPAAAVTRATGTAATVLTGAARVQADPDPTGGRDLLTGTELTAEVTTAVVSFVAIFVMIATFAFVADLRRREMALLRMVGATPRQMRRMIIGEAALIGIVAPVVGAAAGAFGGHLVGGYLVRSGTAPGWFTVGLSWWPVLAGYAAGLVCALAGSTVSAWRAGRIAPVEALRDAAVDQRVMSPLRWLLGIATLAAALFFAVYTVSGEPFELTNLRKVIEIPLLFVGAFTLLLPVFIGPLVRWLTWPLSRLGPGSAIVRANAITAGRRTAATAGAVVVATGVAAAFFVLQNNGNSALTYQQVRTDRAQYFVVPSDGGSVPLATVAALRRVPGAQVVPVSQDVLYIGTRRGGFIDALNVQAVSPGSMPGVEDPAVVSGSLRQFGTASLIVDQKAAESDGLHPGMAVAVWGPDGQRRDVTVAAVVRTGLAGDLAYVSSGAVSASPPSRVDVRVRPGADPARVARALQQASAGQAVSVITRSQELAAQQASVHQQSRTSTFLVLGIALIYSLIAVANTMVMASSGRRRELAALNLTGATRRQVLRFVAAESLVVTFVGAIVAVGAALCVLLVQRLALTGLIGGFPVSLPWPEVGAVTAACAVIGVLAATITSARALRGRVIELAGLRE